MVKQPTRPREESAPSPQLGERPEMNMQALFSLLTHLTSASNIGELLRALGEILSTNFGGCRLTVYELSAARWQGTHNPTEIMCLDYQDEKKPIKLTDAPKLYAAYLLRHTERFTDDGGATLVIPVVLYDRTISHMIDLSHPYQDAADIDVIEGVMNIVKDMFRLLREKSYDPLTRTLNRQAFDQFTADVAYKSPSTRIAKYQANPFNVIAILDIDHFKNINDNFGHPIGDEILVLFAQTIRSTLRQEDLFFRYGGEEFVVFVKTPDETLAHTVLERCREAVENRRFPQVERVTVSIGFAELNQATHPVEQLSKADKALYHAKAAGRNRVSCYEDLVASGAIEPVCTEHGEADFWD